MKCHLCKCDVKTYTMSASRDRGYHNYCFECMFDILGKYDNETLYLEIPKPVWRKICGKISRDQFREFFEGKNEKE